MVIKLNGVKLGEISWVGMGELVADVPTTDIAGRYVLSAYNVYDYGCALMLWLDGNNGATYILDTATVGTKDSECTPQLADGVREYYKTLKTLI